jgi:ABC-type uncharacterized transport system permease subunit
MTVNQAAFARVLKSIVVSIILIMLVAAAMDENPIVVLTSLARGAFGSWSSVGYTLYYATPLIFTGLSVAWCFQSGLFNIGAEGQMTIGGIAMMATSLAMKDCSPFVVWPCALVAGFVGGGLWGSIAGVAKATRNVHEVLSTILLNFIAYGLAGFYILHIARDYQSTGPETLPLPEIFRLPALYGDGPANSTLFIAIVVAFIFHFILWKTRVGFYQRMIQSAPKLAMYSGASPKKLIITSFFISGGIAGLAASNDVLSFVLRLREGFTAGAGFIGIAVALIGRNSAFGIVVAAIIFGALQKGSIDLELDTQNISRDMAVVIQAIIVLVVASEKLLERKK